jgi:hypothetical protein
MPLMVPKKQALTVIMNKIRGGAHSTSEHSSDALQAANDASVGSTAPVNDDGDEINSSTAIDAAAQSAMLAMESKDAKMFQSAIYDMFELFKLGEAQEPTGDLD